MKIGIEIFREPKELRLDRMLLQPFRGDARAGGYPVGSHQKTSEWSRHNFHISQYFEYRDI